MEEINKYKDLDEKSFRQTLLENIKINFSNILTAEDIQILEKGDDASLAFLAQKYFKIFSERN